MSDRLIAASWLWSFNWAFPGNVKATSANARAPTTNISLLGSSINHDQDDSENVTITQRVFFQTLSWHDYSDPRFSINRKLKIFFYLPLAIFRTPLQYGSYEVHRKYFKSVSLKQTLSSEQDSVAGPSVSLIHLFRCISNIVLFSRTSLNRKWTRIGHVIGCYDNLGVR